MNLQTMDRWFRRSGSVAFLAENEAEMFAWYRKILIGSAFLVVPAGRAWRLGG